MLSKGLGEGSALSTLADQPSIDLGSNLASLPLPSLYIHSLTFPLHPRPPSWPCFHRYGPTLLYNLSILLSFLNTSDIRVSNMIIELSYSCIIVDNVQKLLLNLSVNSLSILSTNSNNGNYLLDTLSQSLSSILHALSHLVLATDLLSSIISIISISQTRKGRQSG